ncbi:acyltransferase family protein [Vibrio brasiliensis]
MGLIRLLLALSVIIAHSESFLSLSMIGGSRAVELFFIISGFYMAMVLTDKYKGSGSYKIFLQNRMLKIYPMYFSSILMVTIVSLFFNLNNGEFGKFEFYHEYGHSLSISSYLFLILTNIFIFGQDLVMFLGVDINSGNLFFTPNFRETSPPLFRFLLNPPAWSISIELMFYLIAPFIFRKRIVFIIFLAISSLTLKYTISAIGFDNDPWSYRFFPSELYYFLLGGISFKLKKKYDEKRLQKNNDKIGCGLLIIVTGCILLYQFINININFNYFVVFFAISVPFIFDNIRTSNFDRYIGELSYPVYILHYPVLMLTKKVTVFLSIECLTSEITFLFSILASMLFIKILINPLDKYRQNRAKKLLFS